jgi:diguanylate cyclase (GGDEF)-like protein
MRRAAEPSPVETSELLKFLPRIDAIRSFRPQPVVVKVPEEEVIDAVLEQGGFASRSETIDCGACGYDTCVEHAVAIWQSNSTWDMCFPLQRRRLEHAVEQLSEAATIDLRTGVWNQRAFRTRVREEATRQARYASRYAIVRLGVDHLWDLEQRHGPAVADAIHAAIGGLLRATLRASDVPGFVNGSFFVLLPGLGKTEAFAVAEKIREAAAGLCVSAGGEQGIPGLSLSAGVAASSEESSADTILAAAESAYDGAVEGGGARTVLAPG